MKINWFAPLPPADCAVAKLTLKVLPELSKHAEVTVWCSTPKWDANAENWAKVLPFRRGNSLWIEMNRADANIYHLANDPKYYHTIWELSSQFPGLLILHDKGLQPLLLHKCRQSPGGKETYLKKMQQFYGNSARLYADQLWRAKQPNNEQLHRYSLVEIAARTSLAIVPNNRGLFSHFSSQKIQVDEALDYPCSARQYVKALLGHVENISRTKIAFTSQCIARRVGRDMGIWSTSETAEALAPKVALEIYKMLGSASVPCSNH